MRKTTTDNRVEAVVENTESKILWDWNIRIDKDLEARRTGIIVVNKTNCERVIILGSLRKHDVDRSENVI